MNRGGPHSGPNTAEVSRLTATLAGWRVGGLAGWRVGGTLWLDLTTGRHITREFNHLDGVLTLDHSALVVLLV